jgi:hypothetical protein
MGRPAATPGGVDDPGRVRVSADWDFSDPGQNAIGYQSTLHADHPAADHHFVEQQAVTDPQARAGGRPRSSTRC